MKKFWIWLAVCVLVLIGLANSKSTSSTSSTTSASSDSSSGNSARACTHFHNVARDADQGILTDSELRQKLKEVDSDASYASDEVKTAARHLLAASTQRSSTGFASAVFEMGAACQRAGS